MNKTFDDFRIIRAVKKEHRCTWCSTSISVGEPALNFVGHWEGEFQHWYIHVDCQEPMDASGQYQDDGSICPGPHGRGLKCEC